MSKCILARVTLGLKQGPTQNKGQLAWKRKPWSNQKNDVATAPEGKKRKSKSKPNWIKTIKQTKNKQGKGINSVLVICRPRVIHKKITYAMGQNPLTVEEKARAAKWGKQHVTTRERSLIPDGAWPIVSTKQWSWAKTELKGGCNKAIYNQI